jgi:hypothetical protein
MVVWFWVKGIRITRERSCSVLGAKRKARDSCLVWVQGSLESVVVRFWVQKGRPGIVVWFWVKGSGEKKEEERKERREREWVGDRMEKA